MQPPRFSAEVRARFLNLGRELDKVEQRVDEYEARFQERFTPRRVAGGRIVLQDAARVNMLSAHARARVLIWCVLIAVNADLEAALFLSARAHLEASGMMAYLLHQCRRFVAEELPPGKFGERLDRLFLGRTTTFDDDPPEGIPRSEQAIHVHEFVDSVDRLFDGEAGHDMQGKFRQGYEWLCEFAHPNLQARMGDYVRERTDLVFLRVPRIEEETLSMALQHLLLSELVVSIAYEDLETLLERPWPKEKEK